MTAAPQRPADHGAIAGFIWSIADLLRGDFRPAEYGRVILPFLVLRRLDQVIAPTRLAVNVAATVYGEHTPPSLRHRMLSKAAEGGIYNTTDIDFRTLTGQPAHLEKNIADYIHGFGEAVRDIFDKFRFEQQVARLARAKLLLMVTQRFAELDLAPYQTKDGARVLDADKNPIVWVSNHQMGLAFEELIRRFSEQSNETAGEHFTPREVIRLMVELLLAPEGDRFMKPGFRCSIYDPACGTGGMLSLAEEKLMRLNPAANPQLFGQELNGESYAICRADMLIKGQDADNIKHGNSFSNDLLPEHHFDYLLSNPPFGVDWGKAAKYIDEERRRLGTVSRFAPGVPRKNDGSLLFLLHMLDKMRRVEDGGARMAIVFNGSPLFTGSAGSGESEIRRHVIENDWLEAIVALPDQMFYNTGINTYIWVLSNRKAPGRAGKVVLVNGVERFVKMRKSLGDKRKELSDDDVSTLAGWYAHAEEAVEAGCDDVVIVDNAAFGYRRIVVERPLRLDFTLDDARLDRVAEERAWQQLATSKKRDPAARAAAEEAGRAEQAKILTALEGMDRERVWMDRAVFVKALGAAMKAAGVTLKAPLRRAIVSALGERNPEAVACMKKGAPEPDPELRDYENVPLTEAVGDYMAREVLPHVPDAWVDESKTRVGYEIPFSRYFYRYVEPRPPAEIEGEIRALEGQIARLMAEVLA